MRVAFVVHSLGTGGSERQVITLARGLASRGHAITVFTLRGGGTLERELEQTAVTCVAPSHGRRWYQPAELLALVRKVRRFRPDVVHSYLVDPNLLVTILRPFLGAGHLVWGVRDAGEGRYHRFSALTFRATCVAARIPDLIIANSEAGRRYHVQRGYPANKVVVIENGIDGRMYQPDAVERDRVRAAWGIAHADLLVGMVARLDPLKDHDTFLRAAGELAREDTSLRFVCVGSVGGPQLVALEERARSLGLGGRLVCTGERDDLAAVYSALDVACLSSLSEGFPNVVAEAMACGTPCVVTDVGDAAAIVEGSGVVVPPGDAHALATGLRSLAELVREDPESLAAAARSRILRDYSVERLVDRTHDALGSLLTPVMTP